MRQLRPRAFFRPQPFSLSTFWSLPDLGGPLIVPNTRAAQPQAGSAFFGLGPLQFRAVEPPFLARLLFSFSLLPLLSPLAPRVGGSPPFPAVFLF